MIDYTRFNWGMIGIWIIAIIFWINVWINGLFSSVMWLIIISAVVGIIFKLKEDNRV